MFRWPSSPWPGARRNPHVSTVITGASSADQVRENMTALDVLPLLTKEIMDRVDLISLF